MTFQLLVSTMHKTKDQIFNMLKESNINCDCVVINQCDKELELIETSENRTIHMVFTKERGLSRSRNMAISKATADIVGLADDDLYYYNNFHLDIINYYKSNLKADMVIFNIDDFSKKFSDREYKCNFFNLSGYISMQITFKRLSVTSKFNEYFGTGSKVFNSGEENIFLASCYKHFNKIYYTPTKILKKTENDSTWFKGFDEKYISDRGAIYYAISPLLYPLYIIRFAIFKRKLLNRSIIQSLKLMIKGRNEFKQLYQ